MKTKTLVVILIICLGNLLLAQQGKYKRKSVSSLGLYQISKYDNALVPGDKTQDKMIFEQIQNPRYDYNYINEKYLRDFKYSLKRASVINEKEVKTQFIEQIINETVMSGMLKILNDPELIKIRSADIFNESAYQSFAMKKAKSLGITLKEISQIMNSSYIYLAYIEGSWQPDDGPYKIYGGILWWNLRVDETGYARYENVMDEKVRVEGFGNVDETFTKKMAYVNFAESIGKITRAIDNFKIQGQIIERNGNNYSFTIGKSTGVFLNKAFYVADISIDGQGRETINRKGLALVTKPGVNNSYSIAKQIFGKPVSEGDVMIENSRNGVESDFEILYPYDFNFNHKPTSFSIDALEIDDYNVISTRSTGLRFALKTDISEITGIRNLWHYQGNSLSYMSELSDLKLFTFNCRIDYQWGLFKRFNIRRLYISPGWINGWTFSLNFGSHEITTFEPTNELHWEDNGPSLTDMVPFTNDEDEKNSFLLWEAGIYFSPTVETGYFLTTNTRIYSRVSLNLYPYTLYRGIFDEATVETGDAIDETLSGVGVQSFYVPRMNIGISTTLEFVSEDKGFLNRMAGIKQGKEKLSFADLLGIMFAF
ncbi:MAG: hypothetical protein HOB68_03135 [Candidatus Marinimicrobia bacterium]|nr:hypothetical protein [Candidatus Neomarinimicrobiota bacterium]